MQRALLAPLAEEESGLDHVWALGHHHQRPPRGETRDFITSAGWYRGCSSLRWPGPLATSEHLEDVMNLQRHSKGRPGPSIRSSACVVRRLVIWGVTAESSGEI